MAGIENTLLVLCRIVVAGWVIGVTTFVSVLVLSAILPADVIVEWVLSPPGPLLLTALFATVGISNLLLYVPSCARCSKQLFGEDRRSLSLDYSPELRHHRAKTFMNSYRQGAILELARTGHVNCSWCGHELGAKPDYVVSASR